MVSFIRKYLPTTLFIIIFILLFLIYGKSENNKRLAFTVSSFQSPQQSPIPPIPPNQTKSFDNSVKIIALQAIFTPTPPPSTSTPVPTKSWGVAKQISEYSWTMNVSQDERMANPQEIFDALNNYRSRHGRSSLQWDNKLADFAQSRADSFTSNGTLDNHAGFIAYTDNIENVKNLGFSSLGENSSYGYKLYGVHLIEWAYAGDEPHNNNQLSSGWSHVGIGVSGNQTAVIFGGNKI